MSWCARWTVMWISWPIPFLLSKYLLYQWYFTPFSPHCLCTNLLYVVVFNSIIYYSIVQTVKSAWDSWMSQNNVWTSSVKSIFPSGLVRSSARSRGSHWELVIFPCCQNLDQIYFFMHPDCPRNCRETVLNVSPL